MAQAWRDAVFRIDSEAEASQAFGSGFVCHREGDRSYLLTCNHVIAAIGEAHARIRKPRTYFGLLYQRWPIPRMR